MREIYLREWLAGQYIFDLINDAMPERYKAKLENRSTHPDASREGNALETFRKMRRSFPPKPTTLRGS